MDAIEKILSTNKYLINDTTLVASGYDKNDGSSYARIHTPFGDFVGHAYVNLDNEEDVKYASRYAGCRYAEHRATQKYVKVILQHVRERYNAIKSYYDLISGMTGFDASSREASKARRMIKEYEEDIEAIKSLLKVGENFVNRDAEERINMLKKTNKDNQIE